MSAALIIFIAWIVTMLFIVKSVVKVPADSAYVVKTLGRIRGVLDSGLHLVVPLISQVAARISLLDQVVDVPAATCVMSDDTRITVSGMLRFRVTDPARAVSEAADFRTALPKLASSEWTRALAAGDPLGALQAVHASEAAIRTAAAAWGIELLNANPILILEDDATSLLGTGATP